MRTWIVMIAATAWAQDFTATSANVIVDVAVRSSQRPVSGLSAEDFVLWENGEPRPVVSFSREELPLDIVLVCQQPRHFHVDPRTGMGFPDRAQVVTRLMNAAANAVLGTRPGDRVAIVSYGVDPRIELRFTEDRKAIANAIRRVGERTTGNIVVSSEAVAIEYAMRLLQEAGGDGRRRLIVLISNILGVGTRYAAGSVIRRLWERDIILSVIEDVPPSRAGAQVQQSKGESQAILFRRNTPIQIAQATGGDRVLRHDPQNPVDLLTPIRQRYTLWFQQPEGARTGESRRITVDLSDAARERLPEAEITAREGYVAR